MIDQFSNLPAILAELQDGGLSITSTAVAPRVLVLGTSDKGPSEVKVRVERDQEADVLFGREGNLIKGMFEARGGGSVETHLYRINTRSAILFGVGTDDQSTNPTSIETVLKDASAADVYYVKYYKPASVGANATLGRLLVKNALDEIVYDSNPGGTQIDTGEVIVSGVFNGGEDIGDIQDEDDYVSMRLVAGDLTVVTGEDTGEVYVTVTAQPGIALANDNVIEGSLKVYVDGIEVDTAAVTFNDVADPGPDTFDLDDSIVPAGSITVDYVYDSQTLYSLRDGKDGTSASLMELYEGLEDAYRVLESDEVDIVYPSGVLLDAKNQADGDTIVLSTDPTLVTGQAYPVPGSSGDALGKLHMEEYEGTVYYFWDTDGDGQAEIYPSVGSASATTKIDGTDLAASDFKEVNFAYQLANYCFRLTVNDNFAIGTIGTSAPASNSSRDVAKWLGKLPTKDPVSGEILINGKGLLGNKFMAGTTARSEGFYATFSGNLPTGSFDANSDVIKDRGGNKIDIGKYLSVCVNPLVFFNDYDTTGFGYQGNMAGHYAGFISSLEPKSAPTNKTLLGVRSPFRMFRPKLNELSGLGYVTLKEKEGLLKVTDAPTAARTASDYRRLTTVRIVAGAIDIVREVASPYLGEPNTKIRREALQTSIRKELADYQSDGNLNRFTANVVATPSQVIQGDMIVELELVPAFETRKITVITSLAAV